MHFESMTVIPGVLECVHVVLFIYLFIYLFLLSLSRRSRSSSKPWPTLTKLLHLLLTRPPNERQCEYNASRDIVFYTAIYTCTSKWHLKLNWVKLWLQLDMSYRYYNLCKTCAMDLLFFVKEKLMLISIYKYIRKGYFLALRYY